MTGILLDAVLPIFAVAALGYAAERIRLFDINMAAAINRMVFYLAIPALCFKLLSSAEFERVNWPLLSGYFASELLVYGIGFLVSRFLFHCGWRESILLGLSAAFSNHVLFVLPIAVTLFGQTVTPPIIAIITLDSVVMFGGTLLILDILTLEKPSPTGVVVKLTRNPTIMALAAGLVFGLLHIDIPKGVGTFLDFASAAAAPCSLFALGIALSHHRRSRRTALPATIAALKVVGHPLAAMAIIIFGFQLTPDAARPALMTAAGPCGAMAFVMALKYGVKIDAIAKSILFAMIASVLTVTLMAGY
ncbi:MAG: AEC family transporter [Rhodospirillales bacterium]|nr:AEC family transporter [Rhodospirillales bacterium]